MNQRHHEMILEETHPSGEEEWYCPICGRRFLIGWNLTFRKIVLETGDEYAIHSGAKGAVQMRAMQGTAVDDNISKEELMLSINDSSLTPWVAWLEKVDFERLWDGEV